MRAVVLLPLLGACGTSTIGGKEEDSLVSVLRVVEAAALVSEVSRHGVLPAPETEPTCPEVSRIQGYVTVDYGAGCLPDSGLVLGPVAGSTRLDVGSEQVTTTLDGLSAGGVALGGALSARATPVSDLVVDVEVAEVEALDQVELDITAALGQAPPLRLAGTARIEAGGVATPVTLDEILVAPGACLAPTEGVATIEQGLFLVTFTFAGDGVVRVDTSRDASGELDACAVAESLFGG